MDTHISTNTTTTVPASPVSATNTSGEVLRTPPHCQPVVPHGGGGPIRKRDTKGKRVSRVVFTLNNWTDEEYQYLAEVFAPQTKWMVIGKEVGENGTRHLQGPPLSSFCHVCEEFVFCNVCKGRFFKPGYNPCVHDCEY